MVSIPTIRCNIKKGYICHKSTLFVIMISELIAIFFFAQNRLVCFCDGYELSLQEAKCRNFGVGMKVVSKCLSDRRHYANIIC